MQPPRCGESHPSLTTAQESRCPGRLMSFVLHRGLADSHSLVMFAGSARVKCLNYTAQGAGLASELPQFQKGDAGSVPAHACASSLRPLAFRIICPHAGQAVSHLGELTLEGPRLWLGLDFTVGWGLRRLPRPCVAFTRTPLQAQSSSINSLLSPDIFYL